MDDITKLIKQFGYKDLKTMLKYLFPPNYFDKCVIDYINELNDYAYKIVLDKYTNKDYYKTYMFDILNKIK